MGKSVEWFRDAIVYHIFIDRFSRGLRKDKRPMPKLSRSFMGGNLKGVIDRLSYLKNIGINCIWISPIFKGSAYHGYHVVNFYEVDSHFGTKNDLKKLVKLAHNNNIKVILDFVPNHCSNKHPFFLYAKKTKQSKFFNWFIFDKWPKNYRCYLDVKDLPKINLDYPDARKYMINVGKYWIENFDIDGYRLDHTIGPSHNFWSEFRNKIKKVKPSFVLMGEVWFYRIIFKHLNTLNVRNVYKKFLLNRLLQKNLEDMSMKEYVNELDSCLDFTFNRLAKYFFAENFLTVNKWWRKLKWWCKLFSSKIFLHKLINHYKLFPDSFILPTFLDNHDMNRFLFEAGNSTEKLKLAAIFQFTLSQPPIIHYGTEVGLQQYKDMLDFKTHGGLEVRRMMPWEEKKQNKELLQFYRNLARIRKKFRSLRRGNIKVLHSDWFSKTLAYIKTLEKEKVLVVINNEKRNKKIKLNLSKYFKNKISFTDLISGEKFFLKNSCLEIIVKPYDAYLLI